MNKQNEFLTNWKTTLFGTLATVCTALAASVPQYKTYFGAAATICGVLFALFSKDSNVTGGTVQQ